MAFEKKTPDWQATGIEPPESKRVQGWQVEDRPPAAWLNWFMNLTSESLNELKQKAAETEWVKEQLENINPEIPLATLTTPGIVQLSNAVDGTRENVAATEKAVSLAFQAGNERKSELVAALVAKGIPATTDESWSDLLDKVDSIVKATGDATANDIRAGKKATTDTGEITGTLPVRTGGTVVPSTVNQTKQKGIYDSDIVVQGSSNLTANRIAKGIEIFGVVGNLVSSRRSTITLPAGSSATVGFSSESIIYTSSRYTQEGHSYSRNYSNGGVGVYDNQQHTGNVGTYGFNIYGSNITITNGLGQAHIVDVIFVNLF